MPTLKKGLVLINGCFDVLHPGHYSLISFAATQGDKLIVALNSDASVRRSKGSDRPYHSEEIRISNLKAIPQVSEVYVFNEDTPLYAIQKIQPEIYVKGAKFDLTKGCKVLDLLHSMGVKVVNYPNSPTPHSSTELIRRLRENDSQGIEPEL